MATPETSNTSGQLFEPTPRSRMSAGDVLLFVVSLVLMLGGFYLMGVAFDFQQWGLELFGAGLLAEALGFWLVFGAIANREMKQ